MTRRQRILRVISSASIVFLLLLLSVWIFFSPLVSPGLYRDQVFHPDLGKGDINALRHYSTYENHEVFFSAKDGTRLHGWLFINPNSRKIFLFHPGNAGDIPKRLPTVELLLQSGGSVFIYEPRGFGMSPGSPTQLTICEDGVSAFDYLSSQGYRSQQIVLYGESLGSGVATFVSTKRHASGIIIQSGFASLEKIGKEKVPVVRLYPSFMFPQPRLDNEAILKKPHPPLLLLHGERDTLIPIQHSEEMYKKARGPKRFVRFPHSGHSDISADDAVLFRHSVSDFISHLP